jgi:hypothetical protein
MAGAELLLCSFLTSALEGEWDISRPGDLNQGGKNSPHPLKRTVGGTQRRSGRFGEEKDAAAAAGTQTSDYEFQKWEPTKCTILLVLISEIDLMHGDEEYKTRLSHFALLSIPRILLWSYCLKTSNNMHHTPNDLKLLQNPSTLRYVSVAATIILRESSPCNVQHCCYKTLSCEVFLMIVVGAATETCRNVVLFCNNLKSLSVSCILLEVFRQQPDCQFMA